MKINKYLLTFTGAFFALGTIVLIISRKVSPLFTHTVYYCQAFISSLSFKIPHHLRLFLPILISLIAVVFITRLIVLYFSIKRLKKELAIKHKNNKRFNSLVRELQLANKAFLVTGSKPFAFCLGVRNPKIYVSTALTRFVSQRELKAILLHEKSHLEGRDTTTLFLAKVIEFLFPFFPVVNDLIQNFILEREIRADRAAINGLGSPRPLYSALKKLLLYDSSDDFSFVPSIGQSKTLEVRIKTLINNKSAPYRRFNPLHVFISLLSIIILSLVTLAPISAMELRDGKDNKQKDDVMMVCLSGGTCHRWCKENKTVIPMTAVPNAAPLSTP